MYQQFGLRAQDFIYATPRLLDAWDYTHRKEDPKNIIIMAYDSRLLTEITQEAIYTLREGVKSFRQALSGAILIYKKF